MIAIQPDFEPIPGYRLIQRLGRGGCGEVWKAEAPGGVFKAIKFVFDDLEGFTQDSNAAEQEQKSLQRVKNIRHPFILTTERFEVIEGQLIIVMELADRNLAERFEECTAKGFSGIPRDELLRYMAETAEALDLMNHQHQIQHMDIKPQNIFLIQQHVKVGDFGLAKNLEGTRAALTGGMTPIYAPPESFDGWVSRQSDQYSLAIVYQEMLTGKRPFNGSNSRQLIMQHLTAQPDLSPLPPCDRVPVDRALSKTPEERFPTCSEFVRALRNAETHPVPVARGSGYARRPQRDVEGRTHLVRRSAPAVVPVVRGGSANGDAAQRQFPSAPTATTTRPTQTERTRQGVLYPTLIVGVGGAGLAALQHMRRLMHERYRHTSLATMRWLFVDSDPEALDAAVSGPAEISLTADEVLAAFVPAGDSEVGGAGRTSSDTFVVSETLSAPVPLSTGRWARSLNDPSRDHALPALVERARTAIQEATALESLADAARQTRLEVRSKSPRVYVVGSLGGKTGSAMVVDIAYALKNELRKLDCNPEYVIGLLSLPTPNRPEAFANARMALDDLAYFERGDTLYEARINPGEPPVSDRERPFGRCVFFRDDGGAAQAANLLFAETMTAAGNGIQAVRTTGSGHHYTAVGVRRVLWPRDLVLRGGARRLATETIAAWAAPTSSRLTDSSSQSVAQFWRDRRLDRALVRTAIEYGASQRLGGPLDTPLQEAIQALAGVAGKEGPDLLAAQIAVNQMAEWLSDAPRDATTQAGRMTAALANRADELAADVDLKLAPMVASLLEKPGQRVAGAREALQTLESKLKSELEQAEREAAALAVDVQAAYDAVQKALDVDVPASKSTKRRPTVCVDFAERMEKWAKLRLQQIRDKASLEIYCRLLGAIPEFTREVDTLADRLEQLANDFDNSPDHVLAADGVCEYLFPFSAETADEAIAWLLQAFGDGGRREFDDILQCKLRSTGKGVIQVNVHPEWAPKLSQLVLTEAERYVEEKTNRLSVSQALHKHFPGPAELKAYLESLIESADPGWVEPKHTATFVGVPEDAAGQALGDLVRKLTGESLVVQFTSADEIVILRVSTGLTLDAVRHQVESKLAVVAG